MNELWRFRLSILRRFRAWQLTRAANLEIEACCPLLGNEWEDSDWDNALFLHDDETRAKMTLEAEAMRAVYDDPSWVYRALELWKLSGHNDSQLACYAIRPIRETRTN